jgi:prepilin-type N-terminal cleavage/methylation domain-containing protein
VKRSAQRGFTLIELMISLVLFSFVIAGVLAVAVSMSQGFREQRASVTAEGAVRVPLDFLADAIRQASPGAPSGLIWDPNTCTQNAIEVYNNSGTGLAVGTDKLDVIYASGAVLTSSREIYTSTSSTLQVNDASQLAPGDSIVISDTTQGILVKITGITANNLTIVAQPSCLVTPPVLPATPTILGPYPVGSLVIRAQHAWFYVDYLAGETSPQLMFDPDAKASTVDAEPLAEGVEDLQLVKAVDMTGNGITDDGLTPTTSDEWIYNKAGDTNPVGGTLRAVRVTLVARTLSGLIGNLLSYNRPAVEDHAAAPVNSDNYRRRILRTTAEVRNMSLSP